MPFLSLISPTMWFAVALAISNAICFAGWSMTSNKLDTARKTIVECRAEHDAFVRQVRTEGEQAAKQAKRIETENRRVADETTKGWAAALDVVRADNARKLRNAKPGNPGRGAVPAAAEDRQGDAGAGADTIPSPERLAADCAEATVTANFLQSYIERMEAVQ